MSDVDVVVVFKQQFKQVSGLKLDKNSEGGKKINQKIRDQCQMLLVFEILYYEKGQQLHFLHKLHVKFESNFD